MPKQRWWALATSFALVVGTVVVLGQAALAVHDSGAFQLDGNAQASVQSPSPASDDADLVCKANAGCPGFQSGLTPSGTLGANLPAGATVTASAFKNDGASNASIFTGGGSKDPQDLTAWQWKDQSGGLPDKDNLVNSFAARYQMPISQTCPVVGSAPNCSLLYFGSDRFDNSGDAQQGFWFFQNKVSLDPATGAFVMPGAGGTVVPAVHKVGDILVLSDFSNGGARAFIQVFKWVGTGGDTNGTLQSLSPGPISSNNPGNGAECGTSTADQFCGIVNPTDGTPAPWNYTDKSGNHTYLNGEYYEGGINLSDLEAGLASECFASFESETRSATSPTATLKDFVLGDFGQCGSTTTTTPEDSSGNPIHSGSVSIGAAASVQVKDHAVVQATGPTNQAPSGAVKFFLCGPAATDAAAQCAASPAASGGTAITPDGQLGNASGNTATADSAVATVTAVGHYCWRADYVGDSNFPPSSDNGKPDGSGGLTECFTVAPLQPSFSTTSTVGPVSLGTAIDDTAHLGNTAREPGSPIINPTAPRVLAQGTITIKLYGPNDASCSTVIEQSVINVNGNADYLASGGTLSGTLGSLVPKAAGTYRWIASYTGDSPNTLSAAGGCNDANESVVVNPNNPTISTVATSPPPTGSPLGTAIDDKATLGGTANRPDGTAAGGFITFTLYGPNDATCSTVIETSVVPVHGNGDYFASSGTLSGSLGTSSITPTAAGTYRWIAAYSGDLPNTTAVSGSCNDNAEASLLIQLTPKMATQQGFVPNDTAHIIVDAGAGDLAGSVRFELFVNSTTCSGSAVYDKSFNIVTQGTGTARDRMVSTDNSTSYGATTTFSWRVTYSSTNSGHTGVSSSCNVENSSLTIDNGPQLP
jgi:hypothetical protein